jgi:hypothetical protein
MANEIISGLGGISGAMYSAALNLALNFYRKTPVEIMNDERVKDRHIQISKNFPKTIRGSDER